MLQLAKCGVVYVLLLAISAVWGQAVLPILKIKNDSLPKQVLAGFCAFFIAMELTLVPLALQQGSLSRGVQLAQIVTLVGTLAAMNYRIILRGLRQRRAEAGADAQADAQADAEADSKAKSKTNFLHPDLRITPLFVIAVLLMLAAMAYAVTYRYMGWDQTNYIGTVELFLKSDAFWTRDAMNGGIPVNEADFHYAMSVFYPLIAVLCRIASVDARIMMLYMVRALCVTLSALVVYEWGRVLIPGKQEAGNLFVCVYTLLTVFATASHGAGYMSMIRGYEAKGYCAAVVMPLVALLLVQIIKKSRGEQSAGMAGGGDPASVIPSAQSGEADHSGGSDSGDLNDSGDSVGALWRTLILVSWASIPISPSSLALVPVAVVIATAAILIVDKRVRPHLWYALLAIAPNAVMTVAYVVIKEMLQWLS